MYYSNKAISKFHSCNAHIEHYMDMEMFVSYTTPIAIISYDTTHTAPICMFHQLSTALQLLGNSLAAGCVSTALITMM